MMNKLISFWLSALRTALRWWEVLVVALVGITTGLLMATRPLMHDDLNYYSENARWIAEHSPALLRLPTHIGGSWLDLNGRLADSLNIIWMNMLPHWMLPILCGIMASGFYLAILAWIRVSHRSLLAAVCTTALLMFGMPWWDNMMMFVVQFNYLWSSTVMLFWLWILFRRPFSKAALWLMFPFGMLAGGCHEALGSPVMVALLWTLLPTPLGARSIYPSASNRLAAIGGIIGGAYSLLSPGIWNRAAVLTIRESSFMEVALTSNWAVLLLLLLIAALLIAGKIKFLPTLRSLTGFFTLAAMGSMVFSLYSGMVGRTGWFAQCFAFIAISQLLPPMRPKAASSQPGGAAMLLMIILLGAMTHQTLLFFYRQRELNRVAEFVVESFRKAPQSPIYCDLPDPTLENPMLLGRAVGPIGPYEPWNETVMRRVYGHGKYAPVVLPTSLKGVTHLTALPDSLRGKRLTQHADTLLRIQPVALPAHPTDTIYLLIPTSLMPGERISTINAPI